MKTECNVVLDAKKIAWLMGFSGSNDIVERQPEPRCVTAVFCDFCKTRITTGMHMPCSFEILKIIKVFPGNLDFCCTSCRQEYGELYEG